MCRTENIYGPYGCEGGVGMSRKVKSDETIVRRAFVKLVPVQFFSIIVSGINGMIDSTIVARYMGADGMAAVGLFGPIGSIMGLMYIFVLGAQIKGCEYMGRGDKDKVQSIFSTIVVFFITFGLIVGGLMIVFASPLAHALGSSPDTHQMLVDYIRGYSVGIPAMFLMGLLMCFLQINDRSKLTYVGMMVMMGINIGLDLASALVFKNGLYGMGLATGLSCLLSAFIMLVDFFFGKDKKAVTFKWGNFCFNELGELALIGLPSAMFTIGVTIKAYIVNRMLIVTGGDDGLAVMNAENTLLTFLSAVPQAVANSTMLMAGIYFGQEDEASFKKLFRTTANLGLIMSGVLMVLTMLLRYPLSLIFFDTSEPVFAMCERMLLLMPAFLPINVIYNVLLKIYQAEGRSTFVNAFSLGENLLIALTAVVLGYAIGVDGMWLCLPVGEALAIVIIAMTVFTAAKKVTFNLNDWLRLDESFGLAEEDELSMSITDLAEIEDVSDSIDEFCRSKNCDARITFRLKLCIEELVRNIAEHGMESTDHIDINIIYKNEKFVTRVWDTCKLFDPKSQLDQFDAEDPCANIGIKMVAKMADEMTYISQFGFNILTIVL